MVVNDLSWKMRWSPALAPDLLMIPDIRVFLCAPPEPRVEIAAAAPALEARPDATEQGEPEWLRVLTSLAQIPDEEREQVAYDATSARQAAPESLERAEMLGNFAPDHLVSADLVASAV